MEYLYTGQKLGEDRRVTVKTLPSVPSGQDGTVIGDNFFRFDADGSCSVYHLPDCAFIGSFTLDKSDILKMHCNAVDFGKKYREEDEFPLIYTNIYNNYAKSEDSLPGVCGVYRIARENETFTSTLV